MQEAQFQSLDWEEPLEEGVAINSRTLDQRIPRTWGLQL